MVPLRYKELLEDKLFLFHNKDMYYVKYVSVFTIIVLLQSNIHGGYFRYLLVQVLLLVCLVYLPKMWTMFFVCF